MPNFYKLIRMDASGETEFYAGRVQTMDSRDAALIWINQNPVVLNALADSEDVNMDATFKTVPAIFSQLATVHFVAFDYVIASRLLSNLPFLKFSLLF